MSTLQKVLLGLRFMFVICVSFNFQLSTSAPVVTNSQSMTVKQELLKAEADRLDVGSAWKNTPFLCYVVPAISPVRRLPDTLPPDGKISDMIEMVGAKGEFIPASFVVAPMSDVSNFKLTVSVLQKVGEPRGKISSENIDIKVVKCWWQHGTAWGSYFGDPSRRELVPELLLRDETLVKVDMENKENYLRVDYPEGPEYVWISYYYPFWAPQSANWQAPTLPFATPFDYYKEPVEDSPVLLPVRLMTGQLKQFWVTVKVPEDATAGIYEGNISFSANGVALGKMGIRLRVLPFTLPDPKTYYDLKKPFISSMYGLGTLAEEIKGFDGNQEMAEKRLRNLYRNQREHNIFNYYGPDLPSYQPHPRIPFRTLSSIMNNEEQTAIVIRNLELIKKAGFHPPLFAAAVADITARTEDSEVISQYIQASQKYLDIIEQILGHKDVYFWGAGEPGPDRVKRQLPGWKALQEMGIKIVSEGKPSWHFSLAGYAEDMINFGGFYFDRKYTAPWHVLGHQVVNYAAPHTGPENPDLIRRTHGMMLYKTCFDGTFNYTWHDKHGNWLDFWDPYGYRIKMVYPTQTSVIDTIEWEGFREGIDDIRYATKLKMLAEEAMKSRDIETVYAGKKALVWLELLDEKTADLNAMRMEMINYILNLIERLPEID